jgi:hypothetical protein
MIINGGMQVWQRATGTTTVVNGTYHTADRYKFWTSSDGAWTSEKHEMSLAELNTTGHAKALKMDVTTADASLSTTQHAYVAQRVEAQNCQHLQWGTSNAKTVTISFWVKSNLTGTYSFAIQKPDTTMYMINREYTINTADTWEYKTITITPTAGSTSLITSAAGIINNDNGMGLNLAWGLAWGTNYQGTTNTWAADARYASPSQVNWLNSTSNNFYLTGAQLELGSNATPFEHRSYGDELARCERYFQTYNPTQQTLVYNEGSAATHKFTMFYIMNSMRAAPSVSLANLTTGGGVGGLSGTVSSLNVSSNPIPNPPCIISCRVNMSTSSGTARAMYHADAWANDALEYSAEL